MLEIVFEGESFRHAERLYRIERDFGAAVSGQHDVIAVGVEAENNALPISGSPAR